MPPVSLFGQGVCGVEAGDEDAAEALVVSAVVDLMDGLAPLGSHSLDGA